MIGRLVGKVVLESADGAVVDVGGVGWDVTLPLGALGRAPRTDEGDVVLLVHTHVREDDISLFGFATELDRAAFRALIGVSNVGPRTALAVLGAMTAEELARALAAKDVTKLKAISGIGKKTAERLVLELAGKLPVAPEAAPPGALRAPPRAPEGEILLAALVRMGYRPSEAERAVAGLEGSLAGRPLADSLKEALALLAR